AALGARRRAERRAVVEIGAAIPIPVPGLLLQGPLQCSLMRLIARDSLALARGLESREHLRKYRMQEPTDPDALAPAIVSHAVHAVVPVSRAHERQPVRADFEAPIERASAMLEDRAALRGDLRMSIRILLAWLEQRRLDERNPLAED